NKHKLEPGKFHLTMRRNFFAVRVREPWPRLPLEVVEPPGLERSQTHLDITLGNVL
ncbi:hypothetical protein N320_00825, partial [Buceros rhinoceros silvestris]